MTLHLESRTQSKSGISGRRGGWAAQEEQKHALKAEAVFFHPSLPEEPVTIRTAGFAIPVPSPDIWNFFRWTSGSHGVWAGVGRGVCPSISHFFYNDNPSPPCMVVSLQVILRQIIWETSMTSHSEGRQCPSWPSDHSAFRRTTPVLKSTPMCKAQSSVCVRTTQCLMSLPSPSVKRYVIDGEHQAAPSMGSQ